jgi:hypothetical protein
MLSPAVVIVIVHGHRLPSLYRLKTLSPVRSLFHKYPSGGLGGGNEPPNFSLQNEFFS